MINYLKQKKQPHMGLFQTVDKLEENRVCLFFYELYNLAVDFHSRHSLSAGGRGASSAFACGVSPRRAFPAGVSYLPFQSTLSYLLDKHFCPESLLF